MAKFGTILREKRIVSKKTQEERESKTKKRLDIPRKIIISSRRLIQNIQQENTRRERE